VNYRLRIDCTIGVLRSDDPVAKNEQGWLSAKKRSYLPTMTLVLIQLVLLIGIGSVAVKLAAIAVSSPNTSFEVAFVAILIFLSLQILAELLGIRSVLVSPLVHLPGIYQIAILIAIVVVKVGLSMRLFEVGVLRAFLLAIITNVLVSLAWKAILTGHVFRAHPLISR
jgi:hypothetical protein